MLHDLGRMVLAAAGEGSAVELPVWEILSRRLTIVGCFLGPMFSEPRTRLTVDGFLARLSTGELVADIDSRYPLARASEAHARAETGGRVGRVIMVP